MRLLHVRQQTVKKLQTKLAALEQKERWFQERILSIEAEIVKLEEESRSTRLRGDLVRERTLEEFLQSLHTALPALIEKRALMEKEIVSCRGQLECAFKARKVVEKLEALHYSQRLLNRRRREG